MTIWHISFFLSPGPYSLQILNKQLIVGDFSGSTNKTGIFWFKSTQVTSFLDPLFDLFPHIPRTLLIGMISGLGAMLLLSLICLFRRGWVFHMAKFWGWQTCQPQSGATAWHLKWGNFWLNDKIFEAGWNWAAFLTQSPNFCRANAWVSRKMSESLQSDGWCFSMRFHYMFLLCCSLTLWAYKSTLIELLCLQTQHCGWPQPKLLRQRRKRFVGKICWRRWTSEKSCCSFWWSTKANDYYIRRWPGYFWL